MLRIVEPSIVYKAAMLDAAPEMHAVGEWDITPQELEARFETILAEHLAAKDRGTAPEGVLLYEDFWLLEDAVWIGLLTLRPQINEQFLHRGGHIGYVVRPSRRQQGYGMSTSTPQPRVLGSPTPKRAPRRARSTSNTQHREFGFVLRKRRSGVAARL